MCEQGFLRIAVCRECNRTVAICDECEAVWKDPLSFKLSSLPNPDAQHPECPHCGETSTHWRFLSAEELKSQGLGDLIAGYSR